MATMVTFSVPGDAFPLGRIFASLPDATVELDRLVPTTDAIFPYFWVSGVEMAAVKQAIETHEAISSVTLVDDFGDIGLFRGQWNDEVDGIVGLINRSNLSLLTAIGTRDKWRFEFRAENAVDITNFRHKCRESGLPVELTRLYSLADRKTGRTYDLTDDQHEALVLAFEYGYFEEPREADLDEIAQELEISRQSLAGRLRRGYRNLVESTLIEQ